MTGRTFTARHDGRCAECGDVIEAGDLLAWDIAGRAVHADCGTRERKAGPTCPVCFIEKATSGACDCE